jgi:large subunit ribosomal protein L25
MEQISLDVQLRKELGSSRVRRLRRANIPAVVYGGGSKPTVIQADRKAYDRIHRQHMGESLIYHLNVVDEGKKVADFPAIIKDIQRHPVTEEVIHLDFSRISLDKEIEIKIKIITRGEAIGVKRDGGTIDHLLRELDVICLPTNIPHHIEVDISNLGIHDSIHVKDLALPKGVRTKHDPESVAITVAGSMREEAAVPVAEEAASAAGEPEVLKEKKKEEGAEAKKSDAAPKKEEKK